MERGREASLNSDAGRQREPFPGPSLETVSEGEPGSALFWRRISGTSEPTASQWLRRINLSFAASLKSAGKSAARRSGISEDRDCVYALVGAALRRPPCLPSSIWGTACGGGAPPFRNATSIAVPQCRGGLQPKPLGTSGCAQRAQERSYGFCVQAAKRTVPRFP